MSVFLTTKTVPLDKDIGAANALSAYLGTSAREQLSVVLTAIDNAFLSLSNSSSANLAAETSARQAADANLQSQINSEITNRTTAVTNEATARATADTTETNARTAADTILQNEVDGERGLLRMSVTGTDTKVTLGASYGLNRVQSSGSNGSVLSLPNGSLISDFQGATLDFAAGTITYLAGYQAAGSFSPVSFSGNASKWVKYAVVLLPGVPNTLLILPGSSFGTTIANTTAPAFSGGIPVGIIAVQDNGSAGTGTIQNVVLANLIEFKSSGSGSGGSGSGSPLDPNFDETFIYYTRSDFAVDSNKFLASTTGTDQTLGLSKVILGVGQTLTTKDLIGPQIRQDATAINTAQARLLYNSGKVDLSPTVQFSLDGGLSYTTATVSQPGAPTNGGTYTGLLLEADANFATPTSPLFGSLTPNGTLTSSQKVAAIFTPTYRMVLSNFQAYLRTSATAGSVQAKVYAVSSGMPTGTALRSSGESYAAGTDLTTTPGYKQFTFSPVTLEAGTSYALSVEGTGLNANVSWDQTTSPPAWDVSSATNGGSGWTALAPSLTVNVNGSGLQFVMKVTSGTAASELAGFGVDMVQDTQSGFTGASSWEVRTVTATEASTGLMTLTSVVYVPGAHQLHCNALGHDFIAPDFVEVSPSSVQFPAGFFQAGDAVRFYTAYGLVDSSAASLQKLNTLYEATVGSAAQVAAGLANYASIQAAHDAVATGGYVFVLQGTYVENVTVSKEVCIHGKGRSSILNGTVTFGPSSTGAMLKFMKILNNITINNSAQAVNVSDNWIANGFTVTGGTNCFILNIGE